jgi:ADP-ribosylglycohydrolase
MDENEDLLIELKDNSLLNIWGCALGDSNESKDWNESTDNMVLLLDSAYFDDHNTMRIDNKLFASKLILWRYNGFPELGDKKGCNFEKTIEKLTEHPKYTINPQNISIQVYESFGGSLKSYNIDAPASNAAMMRIAPLALSEDYLSEITEHTLITHYDSRCVVSCLMQCDIIRHILKNYSKSPCISIDDIIRISIDLSVLLEKDFLVDFNKFINVGLISKIYNTNLFDELKKIKHKNENENNYTFESISIMIWSLRAALAGLNYENIIKTITKFNNNTNASIAGAVIGAIFGYSGLPQEWINKNSHHEWLDDKILDFLSRKK